MRSLICRRAELEFCLLSFKFTSNSSCLTCSKKKNLLLFFSFARRDYLFISQSELLFKLVSFSAVQFHLGSIGSHCLSSSSFLLLLLKCFANYIYRSFFLSKEAAMASVLHAKLNSCRFPDSYSSKYSKKGNC